MASAKIQLKRLPLENIRVVECATAWAIPCAGKLLADLGAEVIKVESLTRLDDARPGYYADNDPSGDYWEKGAQYLGANSNKHHFTLNLNTPQGIRIFKELVSVSDVVAENFTPRVMKGFGLAYEELRKVRPDLVMLSSTGFGHQGPWRDYSAFGWGLEPMVISHLTGRPDRPPLNSAIPIPDMAGALHAAFAIMAALQHRRRTGQGQWVDMSQYEIGVHFIARAIMDYTLNGRVQGRLGNRHLHMCPHNAYRCRGNDMWIAIAVSNEGEWQGLLKAMGDPAWGRDPRFADTLARKRHEDELDALIEGWTQAQDHYELMHLLQRHGVPAGAVLTSKEIHADPHVRARGYFKKGRHEVVGERLFHGTWSRLTVTPGQLRWPPQIMGEANGRVLLEVLGHSARDLDALTEGGVIGTRPLPSALRPPTGVVPMERWIEMGTMREYDPDYRKTLRLKE